MEDVKDVIAALPPLIKTLDAGGNIVPPADILLLKQKIGDNSSPSLKDLLKPGAGETTEFGLSKSGVHFSLTLGEAQAYLNALRDGDPGASASVFQDTFFDSLAFITSGDIAIDENDKQQVAQRAALRLFPEMISWE